MDLDEENLRAIIKAIPGNVFFKDTQCRYVYASHLCSMLNTAGRSNFSIIGKTDLEVQVQKELGQKFYDEDCELLKTGGELEYVSKMKFGEDSYYYKIQKRVVYSAGDGGVSSIIGIVGIVTDVTQETLLRQRLEYLSSTDPLTGLKNRASLMLWLSQPRMKECYPLSLISADFDNLKTLNDTHGHAAGDTYLKTGAQIMQDILPESAGLFRIGGDEFLITIPRCTEEDGSAFVDKIDIAFKSYKIDNIQMSVSLGMVTLTDSSQSITEAIQAADKHMYERKREHHAGAR